MEDPDDHMVGEDSSGQVMVRVIPLAEDGVDIVSSSDDVVGVLSPSEDDVGVMSTSVCEGDSQLDMQQYISVEVLDAANVVEVKSGEDLPSAMLEHQSPELLLGITDDSKSDVPVPDMVAAETTVTTSQPRRRKQRLTVQKILDGAMPLIDDVELEAAAAAADSSTGNGYPSSWCLQSDTVYFENQEGTEVPDSCDQLTGSNSEALVALVPDHSCVSVDEVLVPVDHEVSIREITKREKDRLKKRELRANPEFRLKEKEKARQRMAQKRKEPGYRENERKKDRIRRRQTRQRNELSRMKERERDREYKRVTRKLPLSGSEYQAQVRSYIMDMAGISVEGVDL